jgi:hypothetical protein
MQHIAYGVLYEEGREFLQDNIEMTTFSFQIGSSSQGLAIVK